MPPLTHRLGLGSLIIDFFLAFSPSCVARVTLGSWLYTVAAEGRWQGNGEGARLSAQVTTTNRVALRPYHTGRRERFVQSIRHDLDPACFTDFQYGSVRCMSISKQSELSSLTASVTGGGGCNGQCLLRHHVEAIDYHYGVRLT